MSDIKGIDKVYVVNTEKWKDLQNVRGFFVRYLREHDGEITDFASPPYTINGEFTVKVDTVDFYENILSEFLEILDKVSYISFRNSPDEYVVIDIRIDNMWEDAANE